MQTGSLASITAAGTVVPRCDLMLALVCVTTDNSVNRKVTWNPIAHIVHLSPQSTRADSWIPTPNPICPSDSGGRAGSLTKPYKKFRGTNAVTGFSSGLIAVKLSATEIDFVPVPFRYY